MKNKFLFLIFLLSLIALFACGNEKIVYEVILDYGYEEIASESFNINENEEFSLPTPTRDNYKFLGWEYNDKIYNGKIIVKENMTFSAKWEEDIVIISFFVEYVLNGALDNPSLKKEIMENEEYVLPALTKDGMIFDGWYDNPDFKGERVEKIINISSNIVLYAKFINSLPTINYNLNGGFFLEDVKYEYNIGEEYILAEPERDEYIFDGWYDNPDFRGEQIKKILSNDSKSFTLYAKWEDIYERRNITYILDGGIFNEDYPLTYPEGKGCTIPTPQKEGYIFLGWYDEGLKRIIPGINNRSYGDKTIRATWEKIYQYANISYVLDGGILDSSSPTKYPIGKGIDLVSPKKEGYFFRGFYKESDLSGTPLFKISEREKKNITLYAKWEEAKLENAKISFLGDSITTYEGMIPNGYTFYYPIYSATVKDYKDTWWGMVLENTKSKLVSNNSYSGTAVCIGNNKTTDVERLKELSSKGIDPDVIVVYMGINDAVSKITSTSFKNGYQLMIETIKEMYPISEIFVCTLPYETYTNEDSPALRDSYNEIIKTVANSNGLEIIDFAKVFNKENGNRLLGDRIHPNYEGMKVLAKEATEVLQEFYNEKVYEISYNLNGGIWEDKEPFTTYKSLLLNKKLPTPIKKGYQFVGWFDEDENLVSKLEVGKMKDLVLNAKWEKIDKKNIELEVEIIDYKGNSTIKKVMYGDCLEKIENTSERYVWLLGTKLFDFTTPITTNLTIKETWVEVYEIIKTIFKDRVFDDLVINKEYTIGERKISVVFNSSDINTINTTTGRVNPGRSEILVSITGIFKDMNNESINYSFDVLVDAIEFKDLSNTKPVFAYVYSNTSDLEINSLTESTIDVAHYSFARVSGDSQVLTGELSNISEVLKLRKHGIRVLLCIGGYGEACKEFSNAAFTKENREKFAKSIVDTIEKYHFDGVDIDWEYPGYQTGRDTSVDSPNFTLLMKEIHDQVKAKCSDYIVSAALPGGIFGYIRYELKNLNDCLDYIHLMTYDLQSSGKVTHHAAPLNGPFAPFGSVEQTVDTFIKGGVSKEKLVVGIAFYGRKFQLGKKIENENEILGNTNVVDGGSSITFTNIYNYYLVKTHIKGSGVNRYFDSESKAPYIYDKENNLVISYDDGESIKEKCDYVIKNNLGGVMFWDYGEDKTFILLNAIKESLK